MRRADLEKPLDLEDLAAAAKKLKRGKAAGLDGLAPELYQQVPALLPVLLHVWQVSLGRGSLPRPLRTAAVSLIFKKGDASSLDNYRPISVLPTAYKIITKALAIRLNAAIPSVVPVSQRGFVPGRDIRTNILEAHLAQEFMCSSNSSGAMLFVDFVKAYDTLSRDFLMATLEALGFGPMFLRSVSALYSFSTLHGCIGVVYGQSRNHIISAYFTI